jgi:hypothetical protein
MMGVASCFYRRVYDSYLKYLMKEVQKLKKPIDDQSAGASNGHQKEGKNHTHGETLGGHFD